MCGFLWGGGGDDKFVKSKSSKSINMVQRHMYSCGGIVLLGGLSRCVVGVGVRGVEVVSIVIMFKPM